MLIYRNYLIWVTVSFTLLFGQFIFPLNAVILLLSIFFILLAVKKNSYFFMFPVLALSFYHGDQSLSIYTLKFGPLSTIYIVVGLMVLLTLLKSRNFKKIALYFCLLILIYVIYSIIIGSALAFSYFSKELFFIIVSLMFLLVFSKIERANYDFLFLSLGSAYFFTKIVVFITSIGLDAVPYSRDTIQYFALFDPIENFLLLYSILAIFNASIKFFKVISFINLSLFLISSFQLGYMHGGTIIMVLIVILWAFIWNFKKLILPVILIFSLISTYSLSFETEKGSVNYYKIQKFVGLITFVFNSDFSIYDLPRSPQVRVIETANLLNQHPIYLMFGKGFGGSITEVKYKYGSYLNADDYSEIEVKERKFYTLHTYNQLILKHGVFMIIILSFIGWKARCKENVTFIDTCLIFLILSYGYTIKPYILLALFLAEVFIHSEKKLSLNFKFRNKGV
jgi:hypothetical protein